MSVIKFMLKDQTNGEDQPTNLMFINAFVLEFLKNDQFMKYYFNTILYFLSYPIYYSYLSIITFIMIKSLFIILIGFQITKYYSNIYSRTKLVKLITKNLMLSLRYIFHIVIFNFIYN